MNGTRTFAGLPRALLAGGTLVAALAAAAWGADADVDQLGIRFSVAAIAVKAGDAVHFHNRDDVTHNLHVFDPGGDEEDKGLQKAGETVNEIFAKPGEYVVRCAIHPRMKMTVKVE